MAFALIASAAGQGSTSGIDTTGANLILVNGGGSYGGSSTSISDSKGNTWTPLTVVGSPADAGSRIFYCYNPTVGTGHTFSYAESFSSTAVTAWSGAATSPFDVENGFGPASGTFTTVQPGSVTPSQSNELIVTGIGAGGNSGAYSLDSGFTVAAQMAAVSGTRYGSGIGYVVQSAAAAVNPTWTLATAGSVAAVIASFKGTGGPAFIAQQPRNVNQVVRTAGYW